MTSFPVSHKTIFVLDHSPYFAQSCKQLIEHDVIRLKSSGMIPAAPISKTLWTCNIEALNEYMRIVFDIYPKDKLIQVVCGSRELNSWSESHPFESILTHLAGIRPQTDQDGAEYSLSLGIAKAVESLRQPTPQQQVAMDQGDSVKNRGRIICLTALTDDSNIVKIQDYVLETIQQYNMSVSAELLPIDRCELVLVHSVPVDSDLNLKERKEEVSAAMSCEVVASLSGRHLYSKLVALCCRQFDLCSTTVTGIPMKEEQNASSSANYDVELLHPAAAHDEIFKSEHAEGMVIPSKEGLPIDTAPLKWCTPKTSVVELHNCSAAYRICPVDVNSRPSSCLTNFLLSGRAVMLEQPRKSGAKVISHMLAAHGGEIFIHSIPTARSILEDPPSISEGCGGRVTDYRINNFGEFMKENRLAPASSSLQEGYGEEKGYHKALVHLERGSRFWPLVISDTILFNIMDEGISPLGQLIQQPVLTDDDVTECKKAVLRITSMESKNEPLPVPPSGARGKGPKREEQYRHLWVEVEKLVRAFSDISEQHGKVLECVLDCKKPGPDSGSTQTRKSPGKRDEAKIEAVSEVEQSWQDLDRFEKMTEREKQEMTKVENTFESSPPKKHKPEELLMRSGGQTLLSMWNNRLKTIQLKRTKDFDGRLDSDGPKAKLYIHLDEDGEIKDPEKKESGTAASSIRNP